MKFTQRLWRVVICFCLATSATASPIQDPIADYLAMQVPDRSDFVGTLELIDRAKVDLDGDGKDEVFIGTPYRYSGSMDVFWVGYTPIEGGYQRITPATEDIPVPWFEDAYIGPLTEISKQGLAEASEIETNNSEEGTITKVGLLRFWYIADGRLVDENWGALDLAVPTQKEAYDRYFGPMRKIRKATIETFTREQLQEKGYEIPNWEPPSP